MIMHNYKNVNLVLFIPHYHLMNMTLEQIRQQYLNKKIGPYYAWNPVSRTQVWQWCSAMGDTNPLYLKGDAVIAPPTMLQMWAFRDVKGNYAPGSTAQNVYEVLQHFDELGYSATVAVNYDQTYHSYLKEGDSVCNYSTIVTITDMKSTGLGTGYFVSERAEYYNQRAELFGEATITYFKYKPPEKKTSVAESALIKKIERIRPVENHDSKHYWQGLRDDKLLIQQCVDCKTSRHPPQPMCEKCQSLNWDCIESTAVGTVYSYTVIHYPEIPPFDYPNQIVLVDLEEGARLAAQFEGDPLDKNSIGMPVKAIIKEVQKGLSLPIFEPIKSEAAK